MMQDDKVTGTRRAGRVRGVVTQKMVSFRCDVENLEWLDRQPNKGRVINDLISQARNG